VARVIDRDVFSSNGIELLRGRFDGEVRAELTKTHAALPAPGAWLTPKQVNRAVRVTSFECGDKVRPPQKTGASIGCLLHVEVKNLAAIAEDVAPFQHAVDDLDLDILDGAGRRHTVYFLGGIVDGVFSEIDRATRQKVLPGATTELLYRLPAEEAFSETYFNGAGKPFAKNIELYEPVLFEARVRGARGAKDERYLRVK
jgi:hypothetical protein